MEESEILGVAAGYDAVVDPDDPRGLGVPESGRRGFMRPGRLAGPDRFPGLDGQDGLDGFELPGLITGPARRGGPERPGRLGGFGRLEGFGGLVGLAGAFNPGGLAGPGGPGDPGGLGDPDGPDGPDGPAGPGGPGGPDGPDGPEGPDSEQHCIGEDVGGRVMGLFRYLMDQLNETPELNNDYNIKYLQDLITNFINHRKKVISVMSDADQILTACQLENIYEQEKNKFNDILFRDFCNTLKSFPSEAQLVESKKKFYKNQGIRLRISRRIPNSFWSLLGRTNYDRIALIPSSKKHAEKLRSLGEKGYIYPLDDALGISRWPFKMTIPAMIEIAYESITSDSYEQAQRNLQRNYNININDDTIRKVTNYIGQLVYNNDLEYYNNLEELIKNDRFQFLSNKIDYTFYIIINETLIPTRQNKVKGVEFKENMLGMTFSTDHIKWWFDKHGKKQHQILLREYTASIGDSEQFSKLIFLNAIKNGYRNYSNTILISNGASWVDNLRKVYFPDSLHILNFYHLKERITDYVKLIYNDEEIYNPLIDTVTNLFKHGKRQEAKNLLKKASKQNCIEQLDNLLEFINNNNENINYNFYLRKGYFIGNDAIKNANKILLQRLVKFGSMRWNVSSGQAVLTLVAKLQSGLWSREVVEPICRLFGEPFIFPRGA